MDGKDGASDPRRARRKDPQGVREGAWKQTLEDMEAIAADRRQGGWDVITVTAAHTDTVSKDMGEDDEFGLVHILPNNHADQFTETYDSEEFTEYLAYGTEIDKFMYVVTELIDSDTNRSILIASRYDMALSMGLVESAEDEGVLYTHVKTIDGTLLGTFEHEEYEPLVTRPGE